MKTERVKKHPHYWRVKAAILQHRGAIVDAQAAVNAADAAFAAAMSKTGLDPAQSYTLNDEAETITLVPTPKA